MIELKIEPYCEDCPYFEAESYTHTARTIENGSYVKTWIRCEHNLKCDVIA